MPNVRLGVVEYLNTTPLIEGLDQVHGLTLVPAVPSRLVGMLVRGEVDIALASIVDAVNAAEPLTVLPVGMIGSDGPTLTVRLFSRVPPDRITTIFADTDSHTSLVLCGLLMRALHGVSPRIEPLDPAAPLEHWPEAMLLIGDKVVTGEHPASLYPHQLDLGEAWKRLTGMPFVYAAWMCRTSDLRTPAVRVGMALLDRQRRHNQTRLDWIVGKRASERGWPVELAARYLGRLLKYELGERERASAGAFLERASAAGLVQSRTLAMAG
ncbi:MAG: menaquinone biosynthesis protein [Planctomycetota bacterium]